MSKSVNIFNSEINIKYLHSYLKFHKRLGSLNGLRELLNHLGIFLDLEFLKVFTAVKKKSVVILISETILLYNLNFRAKIQMYFARKT